MKAGRSTSEQLALPFEGRPRPGPPRVALVPPPSPAPSPDATGLARELAGLLSTRVSLAVHDNRSTMLSFRRTSDEVRLRVHRMFVGAEPAVVRALAEYVRARSRRSTAVLDEFIARHRPLLPPRDPARARERLLEPRGQVHALDEIFRALNERHFGGAIDARIGWGRGATGRRRRSIRMGVYFEESRTILIHPALDRREVPRLFVEFVVFHEMLHQAVPQQKTPSGRRCIHSAEFRSRERAFPEYERARAWERANMALLLRGPARPVERPGKNG